MAVGGAAFVGTTMVLSSRAFGLADPIPPAVPVYTAVISATNNKLINVTLGPGTAICEPTASSPTTASVPNSQFVVVGTPNRASATPPTASLTPGGTHSLVITKTQNGNSSIAIEFRARYRCTQGATTTEVCRSWVLTFAKPGNSWGSAGAPFTPLLSAPGLVCPV